MAPFSASDLDVPASAAPRRRFPDAPFVSISDNQHAPLNEANWIGTIYHGLPTDLLRPFEVGSYLAFLGRLTTEKGPEAYRRRSARQVTERMHHVMRMQFALNYDDKREGLDGMSPNSLPGRMISISMPPSG